MQENEKTVNPILFSFTLHRFIPWLCQWELNTTVRSSFHFKFHTSPIPRILSRCFLGHCIAFRPKHSWYCKVFFVVKVKWKRPRKKDWSHVSRSRQEYKRKEPVFCRKDFSLQIVLKSRTAHEILSSLALHAGNAFFSQDKKNSFVQEMVLQNLPVTLTRQKSPISPHRSSVTYFHKLHKTIMSINVSWYFDKRRSWSFLQKLQRPRNNGLVSVWNMYFQSAGILWSAKFGESVLHLLIAFFDKWQMCTNVWKSFPTISVLEPIGSPKRRQSHWQLAIEGPFFCKWHGIETSIFQWQFETSSDDFLTRNSARSNISGGSVTPTFVTPLECICFQKQVCFPSLRQWVTAEENRLLNRHKASNQSLCFQAVLWTNLCLSSFYCGDVEEKDIT